MVAGNEKIGKIKNLRPEAFTLRLSPESYELHLQAGLLACRVLAPSHRKRQWHEILKLFNATYSYGDSPGFTPGSHLIQCFEVSKQEPVNFDGTKERIIIYQRISK